MILNRPVYTVQRLLMKPNYSCDRKQDQPVLAFIKIVLTHLNEDLPFSGLPDTISSLKRFLCHPEQIQAGHQ
jgi:hypothetical protein